MGGRSRSGGWVEGQDRVGGRSRSGGWKVICMSGFRFFRWDSRGDVECAAVGANLGEGGICTYTRKYTAMYPPHRDRRTGQSPPESV